MSDLHMLLALMAWVFYWCYASLVNQAGLEIIGIADSFVLRYGWLVAPAILAIGLVRQALCLFPKTAVAFSPGDHVIYRKAKYSTHPGPRAQQVFPIRGGEGYHYVVDKTWTVLGEKDNGLLEVVTPRGKHNLVRCDDPNLRKAHLLESLYLSVWWDKHFPPLSRAA